MNVTEPIGRIARISPDTPAMIRADGSAISYAVLDHAIDRMGAHAGRLGLKPGDIVALPIQGPDESLSLTLTLGLARIGVACAEPSIPAEHTKLRFHVGAAAPPGCVAVDASWMADRPAGPDMDPGPVHGDASGVYRIFSSSGSTGRPKHIPVSHDRMARRVYSVWLDQRDGPATRMIGIGLGGSWGHTTVLRTLWEGGTIVLSNPRQAAAAIDTHGVTSIIASPASLRALLEALPADRGGFASLRRIEVGGSPLPAPLYRSAVERLCPHIVSTLGSAEAGPTASGPVRSLMTRADAVGYVSPGVEVQALDGNLKPLPCGQEGVLRIRGDRVATGYLAKEADSEDRFQDGWFFSSDIGTVWPDGMLSISGRSTDVINAGGVKIHPQVIESALLKLPTVMDAAAFGVPDATGMTRIWAAIVARSRIDDAVLNAFCRHALGHIAPHVILQMKALPRNENGKVVRANLLDIALRGPLASRHP